MIQVKDLPKMGSKHWLEHRFDELYCRFCNTYESACWQDYSHLPEDTLLVCEACHNCLEYINRSENGAVKVNYY